MSYTVLLFLCSFLLLVEAFKETETLQPTEENDDMELLCANRSIIIDFTNSRLGFIGSNFIKSPAITCLELENNNIEQITDETFDSVPNLKYLQMSFNPFSLNNLFANRLEHLEVLLLDKTGTYSYLLEIKMILPKLRKLFLRRSYIHEIIAESQEIFPSLTHLYLAENLLHTDNFAWLPESLEYLDLRYNPLESLNLQNLYNLKLLLIDNSRDRYLRSISFQNLSNLKYLSATSNTINEISSQTFVNISTLEYLDLSDNNIKYIEEDSFNDMKKLRYLNLSTNNIEILRRGLFDKLSKLEYLFLDKNSITMFPTIRNPTILKSISFNCNRIINLHGGQFANMPLLETLFLHDNKIIFIDNETFIGLEKLKVLTLSYNQLSVLPQSWMKPLPNLEELDLTGNNFIRFGDIALSKSVTLKNVYLSKQILYIDTVSLIDLPVNTTISFDENFTYVEQCLQQYA